MHLLSDAVWLARAQWAFTMSFHILFPAISIGLASYLAVLEALWLLSGREPYLNLYKYWLKIFAITFGMGVVSGLVIAYQFGSNWSAFSDQAGPVIGPLMGYEVLTAFFLEAGFLGVMLFGLQRVGPRLHFAATLAVAAGTLFSAFWILSANSWMQTPAGYAVNAAGQYVPVSWLHVIFNPSFPYRFVHMVLAAYLSTSLIVGGVGAFHLLRGQGTEEVRRMFSMAMWMAAIVAPMQIIAGDQHGENSLVYQPAKVYALEGDFDSSPHGAPWIVIGIPDQRAGRVRYALQIPELGSLILKHHLHAPIPGLASIPRGDWPYVPVIFWTFRIMVALAFAMFALGLSSLVIRARGRLYESRGLHRAALLMSPAGLIAVIAGWFTTEVGRQPYTIYHLLRTTQSASPIATPAVAASFAAFAVVYFLVFGSGLLFELRLMRRPPHPGETRSLGHAPHRSAGITPAAALHPPGTLPPRHAAPMQSDPQRDDVRGAP
jgi:cytochrome d ubiquinol oxidase subunit I